MPGQYVYPVEQPGISLKVTQTDRFASMGGQRKISRTWRRLTDDAVKDVRAVRKRTWRASAQQHQPTTMTVNSVLTEANKAILLLFFQGDFAWPTLHGRSCSR